MLEGKVKAALHLITNQEKGGMLPLDTLVSTDGALSTDGAMSKTVHDVLLEKHPSAKPLVPSAVCVVDDSITEPHPVLFDRIYGPLIFTALYSGWMEQQGHQALMPLGGNGCVYPSTHTLLTFVMPLQRESAQPMWIPKVLRLLWLVD